MAEGPDMSKYAHLDKTPPGQWSGSEQEAMSSLDERARRQAAAAAAANDAYTPEAIAAQAKREQDHLAYLAAQGAEIGKEFLETSPPLEGGVDEVLEDSEPGNDFSSRLTAAVSEVAAEIGTSEAEIEVPLALGLVSIQWGLDHPTDENANGVDFALLVQVDDRSPIGWEFNLNADMLRGWAKGDGLQGNRTEHKDFAKGIIEKALEMSVSESVRSLEYALGQILDQLVAEDENRAESDVAE